MEGERRFAFIPVALPHCISLPLPPSLSPPLSFPPSLALSLHSCLFLSHISHQCPLWSNWASHKGLWLSSLTRLCSWQCFQEVCCFHAAIQIIMSYLQVNVQVQWFISLKVWRCRQSAVKGCMSGAEEGCSPSLFGVVLHVSSNVLQIPEQTPLLSNQRPALCSPVTASTSIFYFGKFAVTRISTIRGKFLLGFPSSTRRESDKGKLNSLSLSCFLTLSIPLSVSLSSMAGSFLSPPPLNNSSSNQSFSLCFGPQCLR